MNANQMVAYARTRFSSDGQSCITQVCATSNLCLLIKLCNAIFSNAVYVAAQLQEEKSAPHK